MEAKLKLQNQQLLCLSKNLLRLRPLSKSSKVEVKNLCTSIKLVLVSTDRGHPFKTSACLRGGGVSPCANGQKVTVHKDQKSPS